MSTKLRLAAWAVIIAADLALFWWAANECPRECRGTQGHFGVEVKE